METANLTPEQLEEYAFHAESFNFYKERSKEMFEQGKNEVGESYKDAMALHLAELVKILEPAK